MNRRLFKIRNTHDWGKMKAHMNVGGETLKDKVICFGAFVLI